jgi:hypothetical protein
MAVVHEHDDGGSNAAVVAIVLIAAVVLIGVLFYGATVGHWFGGTTVVTPGASVSASVLPSK